MERYAKRQEKEWLGREDRLPYKPLQVQALEEKEVDVKRRFCPQSMHCYQNSSRQAITGLGQSHVGDQSCNWNVRNVLWSVPASVCWQKYTTFVFAGKGRMGGCAWPSNRSDLLVCLMLE